MSPYRSRNHGSRFPQTMFCKNDKAAPAIIMDTISLDITSVQVMPLNPMDLTVDERLCCAINWMCCGDLGCAPIGGACCPEWYCNPGYTCCEEPYYCCPAHSSLSPPPAPSVASNSYSAGGCILQGVNVSGNLDCNDNQNKSNVAKTVGVNRALFICCIAIATLFLMVKADDESAGGCTINGKNQGHVACRNDNNVKDGAAPSLNVVDLRWLVALCIILNLGILVGADSAGGCIFDGSTVQNVTCNGNNNNNSSDTNQSSSSSSGLSAGDIAGISLGAISATIALLSLFATIVNKDAVVGPDRIPVRRFKRAPCYRIVEGCTLFFGCGCLEGLEARMGRFLQRGRMWRVWEQEVPPAYNPGTWDGHNKG